MTPETHEQHEPVWLSVREYAETRKLSERTVWRLIRAGKLHTERVGFRAVRIRLTKIVRPHTDNY